MCNVQKFAEHFAYTWTRISTSQVRSGDDNALDRAILFALIGNVVFKVLDEFLIVQILKVAHVEELNYSAWHFAVLIILYHLLNLFIRNVFI